MIRFTTTRTTTVRVCMSDSRLVDHTGTIRTGIDRTVTTMVTTMPTVDTGTVTDPGHTIMITIPIAELRDEVPMSRAVHPSDVAA